MKRQREYPFITNNDDLQPRGRPEDIGGTLDQTGVAWLNVFNQFSIIGVLYNFSVSLYLLPIW